MADVTPSHDRAFEEFPLDFGAYLASRWGVERKFAVGALGQWMAHAEPSVACTRSKARVGVIASRVGEIALLTETDEA